MRLLILRLSRSVPPQKKFSCWVRTNFEKYQTSVDPKIGTLSKQHYHGFKPWRFWDPPVVCQKNGAFFRHNCGIFAFWENVKMRRGPKQLKNSATGFTKFRHFTYASTFQMLILTLLDCQHRHMKSPGIWKVSKILKTQAQHFASFEFSNFSYADFDFLI